MLYSEVGEYKWSLYVKPGNVLTFYYHGKARLAKVRRIEDDGDLLCTVGKKVFRLFKPEKVREPELVGRMDRVWLWLRGVRF